jgi:hypothetical protein
MGTEPAPFLSRSLAVRILYQGRGDQVVGMPAAMRRSASSIILAQSIRLGDPPSPSPCESPATTVVSRVLNEPPLPLSVGAVHAAGTVRWRYA